MNPWPLLLTLGPSQEISVELVVQQAVVMRGEFTVIWCNAIDDEQSGCTFNLTLWWNEKLLAQVLGSQLNFSSSLNPFGSYQCFIGSVQSKKIVLHERGIRLYNYYCYYT